MCGGPLLNLVMIATTYTIAVACGHVPALLPMISDLQVYAPEKYVSRCLMPISTLLMQLSILMTYVSLSRDAKRRPSFESSARWRRLDAAHAAFGVISLLGFFIVGAVSEDSDPTVHVVGAVSGFWGLWLYYVLLTVRLYSARESLKVES